MFTYITSGTYPFLKKMKEKYVSEKMIFMQNTQTTQLLHETEGSTLFQSARKFEVMDAVGNYAKEGFIAFSHIPIKDEEKPLFEYTITSRAQSIKEEQNFIIYRVLRPLSGDTYIIVTMWNDEKDFQAWKQSQSFAAIHQQSYATNVFSNPAYVATFSVVDEEIDD